MVSNLCKTDDQIYFSLHFRLLGLSGDVSVFDIHCGQYTVYKRTVTVTKSEVTVGH